MRADEAKLGEVIAAEAVCELQGDAGEDKWEAPTLSRCSPQDIPFIPSLMMGWIYVFGSKSSRRTAESICYRGSTAVSLASGSGSGADLSDRMRH